MRKRKAAVPSDDDDDYMQPFEKNAVKQPPKPLKQSEINFGRKADAVPKEAAGSDSDDSLEDMNFSVPTKSDNKPASHSAGKFVSATAPPKAAKPKEATIKKFLPGKTHPNPLPKGWEARCYIKVKESAPTKPLGKEAWVYSCPAHPEYGEFGSGKDPEGDMQAFIMKLRKEARQKGKGGAAATKGSSSAAGASGGAGGSDGGSGEEGEADPLAALLGRKGRKQAEEEEMRERVHEELTGFMDTGVRANAALKKMF